MQHKGSAWKKTAVATLTFSMLAGSATGLVASAKSSHGNDDGERNYKNYIAKQNNNNNDGDHHDEGDDNGFKAKGQMKFNLNFKDLNENDWKWAYANIIRMCADGVFKGYEDGSFKPANNITRIETIIAAVRLLGLEAEAQKPENMNAKLSFKDFAQLKSKYPQAVGYVAVALKNDLFNENDASIQAQKPATRLWASVLLVKAMKLEVEAKAKMGVELAFKDAEDIPAGSVGYVAVAVEKGYIAGYTDGTFKPDKLVNRAELATILSRLGVQLPDQGQNQNDNTSISGKITVSANNMLTVQKADNTTVNLALDSNVFIFRNNVKVPATSLQVGDELNLRTAGGKVIFIEVTKLASTVVQLNDTGTVSAFTFNSGKIATISITKAVNGVATTVVYNVDANVTVTGGSGVLAANLIVVLKGEGSVVKSIQITG